MKFDFQWGRGSSDLFLSVKDGKPQIFDVEYDAEGLHGELGGRTYYRSRSGLSGAGYFTRLGELIPIGSYRVDTAHNEFVDFLPVGVCPTGERVMAAVPHCSHNFDSREILRGYPTVIKVGALKVVYCDFESNLLKILSLLLAGEDLPAEVRRLRRTFTQINSWGEAEEREVTIEFINMSSTRYHPSPWGFCEEKLRPFRAEWEPERLFQLLSVTRLPDGSFVNTPRIDGVRYLGQRVDLAAPDYPNGWQSVGDGAMVRFYDRTNEVHFVVFLPARETYNKIARRLARRWGVEEEKLASFVLELLCGERMPQFKVSERVVPKLSYLLGEKILLAELRKELAARIRSDVESIAECWQGEKSAV